MSDLAVPITLVVMAVVVAVAIAYLARRVARSRVQVAPLDVSTLTSTVTLFTDAGCTNCDDARQQLEGAGVTFEEFRFDHHPEVFATVGVTGVPLIVVRGPDGSEQDRIAGKVSAADLRRLPR